MLTTNTAETYTRPIREEWAERAGGGARVEATRVHEEPSGAPLQRGSHALRTAAELPAASETRTSGTDAEFQRRNDAVGAFRPRVDTPAAVRPPAGSPVPAAVRSPRNAPPPSRRKSGPLFPPHLRTPERELLVVDYKLEQEERLSRGLETDSPTRPKWNSNFASKPSDEFSRRLKDRKTITSSLGSPTSTPHTSRVSGEVNQLRGTTSKLTYQPMPNLNACAKVDSGTRHRGSPSLPPSVSSPTSAPSARIKDGNAKHPAAGAGGTLLTRTPEGTYFRVPMLPAGRSKVTNVNNRGSPDPVKLASMISALEAELQSERAAHRKTLVEKQRVEELYRTAREFRACAENETYATGKGSSLPSTESIESELKNLDVTGKDSD